MGKIVISGASSEIGLAISRRLAALGKPMLLQYCSHPEVLEGIEAEKIKADFSVESELQAFIGGLSDTDILVNAAAATYASLLPQLSEEEILKMLQVNAYATTLLCRAVIPPMCLRRKGIIVNISSVTASKAYRGQGVYGGTKAYIETLTRSLAAEYAKKGLRFNCVAPGSIDSGHLHRLVEASAGRDDVLKANSSGRLGTPEDVAAAVAWLCSDEARFVNGSVLRVDGGHWLGI